MSKDKSTTPAAWHLTSTIDEMITAQEEAVALAECAYRSSTESRMPDSLTKERFRMWRVRADVLHLLLIMREVDPSEIPGSFTDVMNTVAEQMAFTRKTIQEYKELCREKQQVEKRYNEVVEKYNALADAVNSVRLSAMMLSGVTA